MIDPRNPDTTETAKQGDTRLRLLNYQNNVISKVTNLANLPNLIFLDLYNNNIDTLEGPLSMMTGLRVMMVGKNKIDKVRLTPCLTRASLRLGRKMGCCW